MSAHNTHSFTNAADLRRKCDAAADEIRQGTKKKADAIRYWLGIGGRRTRRTYRTRRTRRNKK